MLHLMHICIYVQQQKYVKIIDVPTENIYKMRVLLYCVLMIAESNNNSLIRLNLFHIDNDIIDNINQYLIGPGSGLTSKPVLKA